MGLNPEEITAFKKQLTLSLKLQPEATLEVIQSLAIKVFYQAYQDSYSSRLGVLFKAKIIEKFVEVEDFAALLIQITPTESIAQALLQVLSFDQLLILITALLKTGKISIELNEQNWANFLTKQLVANIKNKSYTHILHLYFNSIDICISSSISSTIPEAKVIEDLQKENNPNLEIAINKFLDAVFARPNNIPRFIRRILDVYLTQLLTENSEPSLIQEKSLAFTAMFFNKFLLSADLKKFKGQAPHSVMGAVGSYQIPGLIVALIDCVAVGKEKQLWPAFAEVARNTYYKELAKNFLTSISGKLLNNISDPTSPEVTMMSGVDPQLSRKLTPEEYEKLQQEIKTLALNGDGNSDRRKSELQISQFVDVSLTEHDDDAASMTKEEKITETNQPIIGKNTMLEQLICAESVYLLGCKLALQAEFDLYEQQFQQLNSNNSPQSTKVNFISAHLKPKAKDYSLAAVEKFHAVVEGYCSEMQARLRIHQNRYEQWARLLNDRKAEKKKIKTVLEEKQENAKYFLAMQPSPLRFDSNTQAITYENCTEQELNRWLKFYRKETDAAKAELQKLGEIPAQPMLDELLQKVSQLKECFKIYYNHNVSAISQQFMKLLKAH